MILAGDVGGTKTLLGLFDRAGSRLRIRHQQAYSSQASPSFSSIVKAYLDETGAKVKSCAIGVAGPVVNGRSHVVNLRWSVEERQLARTLGIARARVMNDLEATAWGVPELAPRQTRSLTPGARPVPGNAALIAAGTGLGMAILFWDGKRFHPSASEGGHQDLAPRNDVEDALLRYLRRRHDHVSVERIASGAGFHTTYEFLVESGRGARTDEMTRRMSEGDPNAAVSEAAIRRTDETAVRAAEILVSLYGAAAGNLALVAKSTAGVFVGGGIAPKILPLLERGEFLRAFRAKGRLTPLLERMPVRVILEPRTALIGAASFAAHRDGPGARRAGRART